jgi:hypothetical protein
MHVFYFICYCERTWYIHKRLSDVPHVTLCDPSNAACKGKTMQKCSKRCKLLLIMPALFILLQVALALHHHLSQSFYDNEDSLHSAPTAFYPDNTTQSFLFSHAPGLQASILSCEIACSTESPRSPVTALTSDPPQSRAPPSAPLS